jgi:hypothetical protein
MVDAAEAMPDRFAPRDVVVWFNEHYPAVKDTTVMAHVVGLTGNDPSRRHYRWLAMKPPLFFQIDRGLLTRFDPDLHLGDVADLEDRSDEPSLAEPADEERMEFYLEVHLEEFLITNWHLMDWGRRLSIWEGPAGESGHQFTTPVGRLDFLCIDDNTSGFVVVELKRGVPSDKVVGQITRYMGWVGSEMAQDGQPVEGLIVAHECDDRLRYAVSAIPGLGVLLYNMSFLLRPTDLAVKVLHTGLLPHLPTMEALP